MEEAGEAPVAVVAVTAGKEATGPTEEAAAEDSAVATAEVATVAVVEPEVKGKIREAGATVENGDGAGKAKETEMQEEVQGEVDDVANEADEVADAADDVDAARLSGRRQRKKTTLFTVEDDAPKEREIPQGAGTRLEDMPNVVSNLGKVTYSNPHLKMLHSFALGVGRKREFKANLLQFCGMVFPEGRENEARDALMAKILARGLADIQAVMDLADIERGAQSFDRNPTKHMLAERLAEWLEEPPESGRKQRKMRTLKGAAKGAKKSPAKEARTKTPKATKAASTKKRAASAPRSRPAAKKTKEAPVPAEESVDLGIPGATMAQVRARVNAIVKESDATITVKQVRAQLEDWLDADLTDHKDAIRELVMASLNP